MFEGLNTVSIITALGGGLISFFAPCVIPLIPAYISYVSGVSLKDLQEKGVKKYRSQIIVSSLFYLLGFSLIFVILGAFAGSLGFLLRKYDRLIQLIGGLFIIILGLQTAQVITLPTFSFNPSISLSSWGRKLGGLRSFFLGNLFALTWTPCVSAILASILALATVGGDAVGGGMLLFIYSLGISIPFLIVSYTLSSAPVYLKLVQKHTETFSYITGITFTVIGTLLITDTFRLLNNLASNLLPKVSISFL